METRLDKQLAESRKLAVLSAAHLEDLLDMLRSGKTNDAPEVKAIRAYRSELSKRIGEVWAK